MTDFMLFFTREIALSRARFGDHLAQIAFFVMIVTLFPLAVGPAPDPLAELGISIIWIAALLATLPGFERLFAEDYRSGWIEHVCLSRASLPSYILAKTANWYLFSLLPLIIILPLLMVMLSLPFSLTLPLLLSLGLGHAALVLLGAMSSALILGARRTGLLAGLLMLPLAIPILVFGVMASESYIMGLSPRPHLSLLAALVLLLVVVSPLATASALRSALEDG